MKDAAPTRPFAMGDHACAVYSSRTQLVRLVSRFLADGLARYEHCWYVGARVDSRRIAAALRRHGVEVDRQVRHGALRFLAPDDVYLVKGDLNPGRADTVFGDAITQARVEGFSGLRAAIDVSWAASIDGGAEQLIAYEAHAQQGFAAAPVTGLCLYHRRRLPLHVLNGALLTHPLTSAARGQAMANPFYDSDVSMLPPAHDREIASRLKTLTALTRQSARRRRVD